MSARKRHQTPSARERGRKRRYYTRAIEALRLLFGGKCQRAEVLGDRACESTIGLEFAHIAPTGLNGRGRGLPQRVHDIKRNPGAYRLLCRPCHVDFDFEGRDQWAPRPAAELEAVPF